MPSSQVPNDNRVLVATFVVYGEARPAGSKRAFQNKATGHINIVDTSGSKGKTWRADVRDAALQVVKHPIRGAMMVDITFHRARNKGHYGTGKNAHLVKDSAPAHPTVKPDVDKLSRSVLDALTGIVWVDDAQVVDKTVRKRYAETDRMEVTIHLHPDQVASDLPPELRVRGPMESELPLTSGQGSLLDDHSSCPSPNESESESNSSSSSS